MDSKKIILTYKNLDKNEKQKEVENIINFYKSQNIRQVFKNINVNGKLSQQNTNIDTTDLDMFASDIRSKLDSLKNRYSKQELLNAMNKTINENIQPKSDIDKYFETDKNKRDIFLQNVIKNKLKNDQKIYESYLKQMKADSNVFKKADYDDDNINTLDGLLS
jgi:predicted transglutaminase-like cysteine proteinase